MSELLWHSGNGREMVAETGGLRLTVSHMTGGPGFQFRLIAAGQVALASGCRDEMRDAMDAAEHAARLYATAAAAPALAERLNPVG